MSTPDTSLWRHRDFLKLWTGQTISLIGSEVTMLALPLTAVLTLRASAFQMGLLRAAQYVPALLIGLLAGAFIDRMRRRPILMAADLGRALLLGSVPLVAIIGALSMGYLYGIAFLVGGLSVIFDTAYLAFLPALVSRSSLMDANGKLEASSAAASIAGPGLGGLLVQLLTAPVAILADAVSFLVSVFFLWRLRIRERHVAAPASRSIRREIGEGLRFVFGQPTLRHTLIVSGTVNFFAAIFNSLGVLYAVRALGIGAAGLGSIFLVASIFGLVAAALAGRLSSRIGLGWTAITGMLLITTGSVVWPLVANVPALVMPLLMLSLALTGMGDSLYNVSVVSLRQAITPDRLLGRVAASGRFVIWGAQPFGAVLGGALAEVIGLRATLAFVVAGFGIGFVWLACSPIRGIHTVRALEEPVGDALPVAP
jgi:MFS family permease